MLYDPTRFRGNQKPSLLDQVLTNEENVVNNIQYLAPVGSSDHCTLVVTYNCKVQENRTKTKKYKYDKGDYCGMRQFFADIEWEDLLVRKNEQEAWDEFQEKLEEAMESLYQFIIVVVEGRRNISHTWTGAGSGWSKVKTELDRSMWNHMT